MTLDIIGPTVILENNSCEQLADAISDSLLSDVSLFL